MEGARPTTRVVVLAFAFSLLWSHFAVTATFAAARLVATSQAPFYAVPVVAAFACAALVVLRDFFRFVVLH